MFASAGKDIFHNSELILNPLTGYQFNLQISVSDESFPFVLMSKIGLVLL